MRTGFTLLELVLVVVLMGMAASGLHGPLGHVRDRMAVAAARDGVAALLLRAQMTAPRSWGAEVQLAAHPWRAWLQVGDSVVERMGLGTELGVEVALAGGKSSATMAYDALGLGRLAGGTLRFRRGHAEAVLVVSSYGRVTRR